MSSGNPGSDADPDGSKRQPTSEVWGPWEPDGGARPESRLVSGTQFKRPLGFDPSSEQISHPANDAVTSGPAQARGTEIPPTIEVDPQFTHREHVSGALPPFPADAPLFRPAYPPYPSYPGFAPQGQWPGYPPQGQNYPPQAAGNPPFIGPPPQGPGYSTYAGYPSYQGYVSPPPYAPVVAPYAGYNGYAAYPYPYPWQPPKSERDGYLFAVGIISLVGSSLIILAGLAAMGLLALVAIVPHTTLSPEEYFAGVMLFIGLACAGVVGGGFALYHSIRSVFLRKPSAGFAMPQFWIFVLLYLGVVGAAYWLQKQGLAVTYPPLTVGLIGLVAIFPALAVMALGDRRLRFPRRARWPTSWRRFTLAIVSGATLGVGLAAILEFVLEFLLVRGQSVNPLLCVDRPNAPNCQNPMVYSIILLVVAVMAPLIEETVKPLAVIVLIGRIRSAAEAFVLGLAAGIGFNLIETTGYISSGYQDWLSIALIRTGSGLLHGFGAAMVALGWYYLTHPGKHRLLKAVGCWLYAVLQHALWNGSWGIVLLPAPVGPYFNTSNVIFGPFSLPSYAVINIVEVIFMLVFFIYMTGRLRKNTPPMSMVAAERMEVNEAQKVLPS